MSCYTEEASYSLVADANPNYNSCLYLFHFRLLPGISVDFHLLLRIKVLQVASCFYFLAPLYYYTSLTTNLIAKAIWSFS